MKRSSGPRRALLLLALCAIAPAGCSDSAAPPASRVLLIGVDGLDWSVLDPLIEQGALPNFARLKREGASGVLMSHEPIFSPVVWTTIGTGKLPAKHGIHTFTVPLDSTRVPVTSNLLRCDRVWDILGKRGRTTGSIGWWATWPAVPVPNGFVLSERAWPITFGKEGWPVATETLPDIAHRSYPEDLIDRVDSLVVTRDRLTAADMRRVDVRGALATLSDHGPSCADMYAKDLTFLRMAEALYPALRPEFFTVYLELTDVMAHYFWQFWRYYRHRAFGEPTVFDELPEGMSPESAAEVGRNFEGAYHFADEAIGRLLRHMDDQTLVLVVSDHGYGENVDGRRLRVGDDVFGSNPHWHRLEGVILAWGYGVDPGTTIRGASVTDVTPTVLYAMGEPVGADMDGAPLRALFTPEFRARGVEEVPTLETSVRAVGDPIPSPEDSEYRDFLKSLGYIN